MPSIEHNFLIKSNEDGTNEWTTTREPYSMDVVLFLFFDPQKGFLLERRTKQGDALFGKMVIPGGKVKDLGEKGFPLWAAERELLEELGIVARSIIRLDNLFDPEQRNMLYPYLMSGVLWGSLHNNEPNEKEFTWITLSEIFQKRAGRTEVNPIFELETTRLVLLEAKAVMERLDIN